MGSKMKAALGRTDQYGIRPWQKETHLHKFKAIPDPEGNRAERRAAKKFEKKKGK